MSALRAAQARWRDERLASRGSIFRRVRALVAERSARLVGLAAGGRCAAEVLTSEVVPLAEAARFLEKKGALILRPRRVGAGGAPVWLRGTSATVRREPWGVVMIIAPSNYPLLLPGVQLFQALMAGNAVVLKPGAGGLAAAEALAEILCDAGLNPALVSVVNEEKITPDADKVFFTGSAETGATILGELAPRLVPATMELSGCDAVFVRADADFALAADAIAFGLRLNSGRTCIAPRRVFVSRAQAAVFEKMLVERGVALRGEREGAWDDAAELIGVRDDEEALALAAKSAYALGASIFSRDEKAARVLAMRVAAGVVVINDMIVPTADARLPFGGRGRSGFGVTRGPEGLLEMTWPKVIATRAGNWRPHFENPRAGDAEFFAAYLEAVHGGSFGARMRARVRLIGAAARRK